MRRDYLKKKFFKQNDNNRTRIKRCKERAWKGGSRIEEVRRRGGRREMAKGEGMSLMKRRSRRRRDEIEEKCGR
jgi:hypothetical protein